MSFFTSGSFHEGPGGPESLAETLGGSGPPTWSDCVSVAEYLANSPQSFVGQAALDEAHARLREARTWADRVGLVSREESASLGNGGLAKQIVDRCFPKTIPAVVKDAKGAWPHAPLLNRDALERIGKELAIEGLLLGVGWALRALRVGARLGRLTRSVAVGRRALALRHLATVVRSVIVRSRRRAKNLRRYLSQAGRLNRTRRLKFRDGGGNVAVAHSSIDGVIVRQKAFSGVDELRGWVNVPERRVLSVATPKASATDAELKVLEELMTKTSDKSRGYVILYTEKEPCAYCEEALDLFRLKRPGIEVKVVWDVKVGDRASLKVR